MLIGYAYAQAQQAVESAPGGGGPTTLFLFFALIALFWFMVWRPQAKRNKDHATLVAGLQVGDEVVTHAGIAGRIVAIGETNYLTMEISRVKDQPVEIRIQKAAISIVLPKGSLEAL